jgi:3-methyladenine DNA glycosylase Mpg
MMPEAEVVVLPAAVPAPLEVVTTPRIGITKAADWLLRFAVKGNPHVSGRGGRMRAMV